MNGNNTSHFDRPFIFPVGAHDDFLLQGFANGMGAHGGGSGIAARRAGALAPSREFESELLHLVEARNWRLARIRAESFSAEARPTSAAYRGISQTALSSAVRNGAPLETVRAILRANPDALISVRHARRATVLHEAMRNRAAIDVISFLVDEALRLEESRTTKEGSSVPIWGQTDDSNRTILHLLVGRICSAIVQVTPRSTISSVTNFRSPPHFRGSEASAKEDIDQMLEICHKIATAYPESLSQVDIDGQNPLTMALITPPPGNFAQEDSRSFIDKTIERMVSIFCNCRPDAAEQSIAPNQMGIMSGASLQRVRRGGIRYVNRQHRVLTSDEDEDDDDDEEKKNLSVNVGPNALYAAIIHHRSVETIEKLLTANPSSNRAASAIVTVQMETPLHVAVSVRAPVDVIRLLLAHCPEAVIAGDRHNLTPLDWVWIRHVLDRAYLVGRSNTSSDDNGSESDADSVAATLPQFQSKRPYLRRTIPSTFLQNWKDAATEIETLSEVMNGTTKATKRMRVGSFTNYRVTTGALWERVSLMLPVAAREMHRLLEQTTKDTPEEWPVYHAASYFPCPVPFLDLAFFYYPDQVKQKDSRGFLPIHWAASNPYHDVTFDLPDGITSGVSPYIRAQHRTTFSELSPISRVIKHSPPEASHTVTPDGRLPLHIALEMIKDHQSAFRVACQSAVFASVSSQKRVVPWEISRSIVRSLVELNTTAFERQDPRTHLYPFMQAAVGDNADVDLIFLLLREHPSICTPSSR